MWARGGRGVILLSLLVPIAGAGCPSDPRDCTHDILGGANVGGVTVTGSMTVVEDPPNEEGIPSAPAGAVGRFDFTAQRTEGTEPKSHEVWIRFEFEIRNIDWLGEPDWRFTLGPNDTGQSADQFLFQIERTTTPGLVFLPFMVKVDDETYINYFEIDVLPPTESVAAPSTVNTVVGGLILLGAAAATIAFISSRRGGRGGTN